MSADPIRHPNWNSQREQSCCGRLLEGLAAHGARHLAGAQTDLAQTGTLLDEAIIKLASSFMELHAAVTEQQQQIVRLLDAPAGGIADAERDSLRALAERVDTQVNAAVTGLQFQDLTNQLIGRTARRIAALRDMLDSMEQAAQSVRLADAAAPGKDEGGRIGIVLENAVARLENQSRALDDALSGSVPQTHMDSGDIELF